MSLWKQVVKSEDLNKWNKGTLAESLGIEFIEIGTDFLKARMPVDERTKQPFGLLHGGSNVALAESLGSYASSLCIPDLQKETAVGVEINANHLQSARSGFVYGVVKPIRIGKRMHVWDIEIRNDMGELTCVSRLTIAVIKRK